jgi:hypothetical protein
MPTASEALYGEGPKTALGNEDREEKKTPQTLGDHIDESIGSIGKSLTEGERATLKQALMDKFKSPSFLQFFVAGAKDFGEDVSNAMKGEISHTGPSMKHRMPLLKQMTE